MPTESTWVENGTPVTVVSVTANMASGQVAGNNAAVNNSVNRHNMAKAVLNVPGGFASAPSGNAVIELYIRESIDGTNYDSAGSTITATPAAPSGLGAHDGATLATTFLLANSNGAQRNIQHFSILGVLYFQAFIRQSSGQTANASAPSPITVTITTYNDASAA